MPRRVARWKDAVGTAVAGLWPVALTLGTLRNPSRYSPYNVYSGLGSVPLHSMHSLPSTDPNVYATSYTLGLRAASMLAHGHLPWWNAFQGLGSPLIGEPESGGLFPLTPLLLIHDGSLWFHLALEIIAGVATYWLLREFKCGPVVATAGGMLYATNGTLAWLLNAAFNPVCFLPLMLLGIERARRASADARGGGWRWLAVGAALALLAGFVETAALGLVFVTVIAVQRGWTLSGDRIAAFARKTVAGLVVGIAIAGPMLVAFGTYLRHGYVAEHAGNAAGGKLGPTYVAMTVSPYLFGHIYANAYPAIHGLWGAVGGYAGFALLALAVAAMFGRRDRGLRITLGMWVVIAYADTTGVPGVRQLLSSLPLISHIVLYRYLPPTWELALVVLAAFALRDLATSSRAESMVAIVTGILASATVLLVGVSLAPASIRAARALTPTAFHQSELIVIVVVAGLVLAALAPPRVRSPLVAAVVVAEAAFLFSVPLLSWPSNDQINQPVVTFLAKHSTGGRFFALGAPSANFGSQIAARQLNVQGQPVPKALVSILATLDPYESPTAFRGVHRAFPGAPTPAQLVHRNLVLLEQLGVRYVVAPTRLHLLASQPAVVLAYHDEDLQIWLLPHTEAIVRAPGCGLSTTSQDEFVANCPHRSVLLRTELALPGWSATVNGVSVPVRDRARFQALDLPKGHSVISLTFLPPFVPLAGAAALVALVSLLIPYEMLAAWRRRRRDEATSGLATLGASLAHREPPSASIGAEQPLDAPTGAIAVTHAVDEDPPTSAVPALDSSRDEADGEDPPTSSVAAVGVPAHEDPPTLAVPLPRDDA